MPTATEADVGDENALETICALAFNVYWIYSHVKAGMCPFNLKCSLDGILYIECIYTGKGVGKVVIW